jgi:hypothetical protein
MVVDFVVVAVSLSLEAMVLGFTFGKDFGYKAPEELFERVLLMARIWRFVRVGHGVYEMAQGVHEMHEMHEVEEKLLQGLRETKATQDQELESLRLSLSTKNSRHLDDEDDELVDFDDAISWPLEANSRVHLADLRHGEVDWTGRWTCVDQKGMDGFLRAVGTAYFARQAASALKFGVGKETIIERSGQGVWIARSTGRTMSWSLAQAVVTADGTVYAESCVDGVLCTVQPRDPLKARCEIRRTLVDGRMIVHMSANGTQATRTFVKSDSSSVKKKNIYRL